MGVLAGPVERLLDRDDTRIARRLPQELHHHVEALVGMVDDDVLVADRREAVAAVADTLREARVVGGEDEVGALLHDELLGVGQADQPFQHETSSLRHGVDYGGIPAGRAPYRY